MTYQDRIYGKTKIEEPVILELIKSQSFQRLKGIDQVGYLPVYLKVHSILSNSKLKAFKKLTRFEHSLGVFILLKKFNASFEEQIAGLIHDISHGVFSHAMDYTLKEGSEKNHTFQDNFFEKFIKNSEIPQILKKHKLDLNYILNKDNFPLLEKELPDLCADRLDYSLRNAVCYNVFGEKEVAYFIGNLLTENNFWIFKNFQSAKKYAELFLELNTIHYAGFPTAVMFRTVGDLLKYALRRTILKKDDLFTTDKKVIGKIKKRLKNDRELRLLFNRMQGKAEFENNPKNYDVKVFCKSRIVDPLCKYNREIKRVSEIDENWAVIVEKELIPKEYSIKFRP